MRRMWSVGAMGLVFAIVGLGFAESAAALNIVGRRIDIKVQSSGYEPARVTAKTGEAITLVFTRTGGECGAEVVIPSLNIRQHLPKNEPVAIPMTPAKSGEIAFTCGMKMMKGAVVVTD